MDKWLHFAPLLGRGHAVVVAAVFAVAVAVVVSAVSASCEH